MRIPAKPVGAAVAIVFALLTFAAYGSGEGPGTTGSGDADELGRLKQAGSPTMVIEAPVEIEQAPAQADDKGEGKGEGNGKGKGPGNRQGKRKGKGHGLGNTYCQSLKGTGGPAFGHCIAAKAHQKHSHGRH